jgi:hypothetical protein
MKEKDSEESSGRDGGLKRMASSEKIGAEVSRRGDELTARLYLS